MGNVIATESMARAHGGADAQGIPAYDFSTNSNAVGPCPVARQAVAQVEATRYPDPHYTDLRTTLAGFHGVDAGRIVLAASGSEFIFRITAWMARSGCKAVSLPTPAYGDYAHAAQQWGLQSAQPEVHQPCLVWACEPSSPLGMAHPNWHRDAATVVWDCAYVPLRLSGSVSLSATEADSVWRLWSPNKAMGMTGVRAAYAIAPAHALSAVAQLNALVPSWPVGAHGVALLHAWTTPSAQSWLAESLDMLRTWKARQLHRMTGLQWECCPSETPFFCARPNQALDLAALRAHGIKLRDTASMGLPGWYRLSVQPPHAQDALVEALAALQGAHP